MFLDRLQDVGIEIYGDNSKVTDAVQEIAESVIALLPRMGSSMLVAINDNTLHLTWSFRLRSMKVSINSARRVCVQAIDGPVTRAHYCAGESSALGACLQKGLDVYLSKSKASM